MSSPSTATFDEVAFRGEFPVLARSAYLNAGTDGPLPQAAIDAAARTMARAGETGRAKEHFELRGSLSESLRAGYAKALGAQAQDVALTTCTTEGLCVVIDGLGLRPGDEIVTSDEEHPGLLGALAAAVDVHGASVKVAPFAEIANAVGGKTKLVACSHVSWMTGSLCPPELAEVEVPVILDGAQGVGAVPVDVGQLRCAAYSGAGQKWLCGPDGLGMLYVTPELRERIGVTRRGYSNMVDPNAGLHARLHEDARRFDTLSLSAETLACGLAAWETIDAAGLDAVLTRGSALAQRLVDLLQERGREVTPRSASTLVSFASPDPEAERAILSDRGVVLRDIPSRPWLRASVGAWNDEDDLQRLLSALPR